MESSSPRRYSVVSIGWRDGTSTYRLLARIHLSIEIEPFYFNYLLADLIDYEHARSSSKQLMTATMSDQEFETFREFVILDFLSSLKTPILQIFPEHL